MRRLLLLICAILPIVCMAQNRIVKGIVYDTNDTPMVGVTVKAVNSSESTVTTDGGNFTLNVSQYERYIEVQVEGYFTTRAEVDGSFLIVRLKYDKKYWDNKAKAAEEAKKAEEEAKKAEQERLEAERIAAEKEAAAKAKAEEEARIAEQQRLEAERIAAEKAAAAKAKAEEEARIAEQRRLEAERIAAEKAAAAKAKAEEEARIAEQRRLEAERIAAEKAAAAKAKAEEKARIAAEKEAAAKAKAEAKARATEEKSRGSETTTTAKDVTTKEESTTEERGQLTSQKQRGFGSIAELSTMIGLGNRFSNSSIRYIAGYHFNNSVYLGIGAGANLNYYGTKLSGGDSLLDEGLLTPKIFSVPVFAFFKANFVDRTCSPFFALAAGFNFSPKQTLQLDLVGVRYSVSAPFVNPQVGINFRATKETSIFFAVGFQCMAIPSCVNYTPYNATFKPTLGYGVDIHLGFTF